MGSLELAGVLKAARVGGGVSVRGAALSCGLGKSHYERLEAGRVAAPTVATIDKLAAGLGVSRGSLLRAAGYV